MGPVWDRQARSLDHRHHRFGRRRIRFQIIHPLDCDLEVALVIARDQIPLLQIPQREIQSFGRAFEDVFDESHREARSERLQAASIVKKAKQSRTQGGLTAQRLKKVQPAELKLGIILANAFQLVEFSSAVPSRTELRKPD